MTHLTLTGVEAGRVLCGAPKSADEQYLHAMYAPIKALQAGTIADYQPLCEKCLKVWESLG